MKKLINLLTFINFDMYNVKLVDLMKKLINLLTFINVVSKKNINFDGI